MKARSAVGHSPSLDKPGEEVWIRLGEAARAAAANAYSKYSGFRVGAALLADDGSVYVGCNVENASYGLTVCAERNAVFSGVTKGMRKIVALVVYTPTPSSTPPCGACRQVIAEFGHDVQIRCLSESGDALVTSIGELLPHAFDAEAVTKRG